MTDRASGPALPGEECPVPPHDSWSELEKWVWHEIGSGRIADINVHLDKTADPTNPDDWGPERRLSSAFLETVLLHDPWRSAIPRRGVRIVGALFDETVDLGGAYICRELCLEKSRFTSNIELTWARAKSLLSLSASTVEGKLDMDAASIGGSLDMNGAELSSVTLLGTKIEGQLALTGAKVTDMLTMSAANIGRSLFMRADQQHPAEFGEVRLRYAKIGGQLSLTGAKVTGTVTMSAASIGGSLFMREGQFSKPIKPIFARIGGNLDVRGATLAGLELTGARVEGELRLASGGSRPTWSEGARLVLRNTWVGAVQDEPGAWPMSMPNELSPKVPK